MWSKRQWAFQNFEAKSQKATTNVTLASHQLIVWALCIHVDVRSEIILNARIPGSILNTTCMKSLNNKNHAFDASDLVLDSPSNNPCSIPNWSGSQRCRSFAPFNWCFRMRTQQLTFSWHCTNLLRTKDISIEIPWFTIDVAEMSQIFGLQLDFAKNISGMSDPEYFLQAVGILHLRVPSLNYLQL